MVFNMYWKVDWGNRKWKDGDNEYNSFLKVGSEI